MNEYIMIYNEHTHRAIVTTIDNYYSRVSNERLNRVISDVDLETAKQIFEIYYKDCTLKEIRII